MAQTIRWAMTENIKSPAKGNSSRISISIAITFSHSFIFIHKF